MYETPIIVFGVGRTGTSAVARVLHEKMDVNMGIEFKPADWRCPDGHYEDKYVKQFNNSFLAGHINFPEWETFYVKYTKQRLSIDKPWGFKDPKISDGFILGFLISFYGMIGGAIFIRCNRDKESTVKSLIRCYEHTPEKASLIYDNCQKRMDVLLEGKKHIVIDMTERLSDEEIAKRIRNEEFPY